MIDAARLPRLLAGLALVAALGWSLVLAQAHLEARATVLDRLEASLLDLRFLATGPRKPPPDVLIVAVDDETNRLVATLPLPRAQLARIVETLFRDGAKAVALDFLFLDPTTPDDDDALAKAMRAGPVVTASEIVFPVAKGERAAAATALECRRPIAPFRQPASGFVNISLDRSGMPRFVPMLLPCERSLLPAMALRAAALARGVPPGFGDDSVILGDTVTPLDVGRHLVLRPYGPEGTITTVSAAGILNGTVPAAQVAGRTVVVGTTASGTGDRHPTPFDSDMPGVEVQATALANLLAGDALRRTTSVRRVDSVVTVGLALAAVLLLTLRRIGIGLAGIAALLVGLLAFAFAGFTQGYWFALAMPLAALVPVTAVAGAGRLALDRWRERALLSQQATLGAFQSPAILARLKAEPDFLSRPVERDIAVVFIDLTGFTGLSERLGPRVTRDLIQQFQNLVQQETVKRGGIVASSMGDGAMLIWGMAATAPDDALQAVCAAMALKDRTFEWLETVRGVTGPKLSVKLGGHLGSAILSRLGSADHQHITAIGDTVNAAARLMEVAAEHEAIIALSDHLLATARLQGIAPGDGAFTDPVEAAIRGRSRTMPVCFWTGEGP